MSAPVFHYERAADHTVGANVTLAGVEGHHASTVRRVRPGERLVLTDGVGTALDVEVVDASPGEVTCRVVAVRQESRPFPSLTVVQALPKGDRGERAIELLTEVGADVLVPWQASRCVSRWRGEKVQRGRGKWQAVAREAAKQSRRTWWPTVTEAAGTDGVAELLAASDAAWVLHEGGSATLAGELAVQAPAAPTSVALVVGPEGGVTDDELAQFAAVGAVAVRLGPTVLRTSTAGVVGASLVLGQSEAWRA